MLNIQWSLGNPGIKFWNVLKICVFRYHIRWSQMQGKMLKTMHGCWTKEISLKYQCSVQIVWNLYFSTNFSRKRNWFFGPQSFGLWRIKSYVISRHTDKKLFIFCYKPSELKYQTVWIIFRFYIYNATTATVIYVCISYSLLWNQGLC